MRGADGSGLTTLDRQGRGFLPKRITFEESSRDKQKNTLEDKFIFEEKFTFEEEFTFEELPMEDGASERI